MRYGRRLVLLVAWLALFDQFVPALLARVERARYETGETIRFENSDLFALGPLVEYLRDHPTSDRPRVVFFGNSVVWGYGLNAPDTLPAQFQTLTPGQKVFNIAVNGFESGSMYLIAKALAGSVQRMYVQLQGTTADPMLPSLFPVGEADRVAFDLPRSDTVERRLDAALGRVWRLYGATYRIQSAVLGSSTPQYLYFNKGKIARAALRWVRGAPAEPPPPPIDDTMQTSCAISAPRAETVPGGARLEELRRKAPMLWKFAELAQTNRVEVRFLLMNEFDYDLTDADVADLNVALAPWSQVIHLRFPRSLTHDGQHLNIDGGRQVALALAGYERGQHAQ